jgi:hypothetical protein
MTSALQVPSRKLGLATNMGFAANLAGDSQALQHTHDIFLRFVDKKSRAEAAARRQERVSVVQPAVLAWHDVGRLAGADLSTPSADSSDSLADGISDHADHAV